ncbi:MAG: DUF4476 domain-containing protein [Bacteroidota bacterium]|nr:DUF4476 domain-containing protein [Bacteroidota bacterium]
MQKLRLFGMNGLFTFILACTAVVGRGQTAGYLILIDADDKQPFTARIGDNLMASTLHGHLIIPQLQDSSYQICIRFPRQPIAEQVFPVRVGKKDHGFQLQGTDSSWVLYNWQSRETIHSIREVDSSRLLEQGIKRENGFSRLMAAVVNDTSVMYDTYVGAEPPKDTVAAIADHGDSTALLASIRKKPETDPAKLKKAVGKKDVANPGTDSVKLKQIAKTIITRPEVKKLREVSLKVSRKMVFLDASPEGGKDTITLFVYFEHPALHPKKPNEDPMVTARRLLQGDSTREKRGGKEREKQLVSGKETIKTAKDSLSGKKHREDPMITARRLLRSDSTRGKPAGNEKEKQEIPGSETVKTTETDTISGREKPKLTEPVKETQNQANSCQQQASDPDVEALRSAILTGNTLQDKISVASGAFAMKCFSVSQLRLLVDLFVSDKAKYKFIDTAHGHVSDPDHFQELADTMTDKAYLKKFRMLVQKKG